ncbi:PREDICTED: uncharacterized protein [Prunus dulcis]|uniref:PREDICTED: uncharacterized protein n=1 Tax=Prunus dulcis TaxID=3755 RepID=A0A5E4GIM3_PRUDU|nr:PREDICTED: uncharacterized protein [Prunus dulcis]
MTVTFANAIGLEGVVNLQGKSIGSSAQRRLSSQQHGSSQTGKKNFGEGSGGCRSPDEVGIRGTPHTAPSFVKGMALAATVTSLVSKIGQRGTSKVVPVVDRSTVLTDSIRHVQAPVVPVREDMNAVIAPTSDLFNFMPIVEQSAIKVKGCGCRRPRRGVDPIGIGTQGVFAPSLKRKHLAAHPDAEASQQGGFGAPEKRHLYVNVTN